MDYIELDCKITPKEPFSDLVIAALADVGYDMFEDYEEGIRAYVQVDGFNESALSMISYFEPNARCKVEWSKRIIKHQNWNVEWEKNFEPVVIAGKVLVRAVFHHPGKDYPYEIIIQPKMSFGTGHHETTSLVMTRMLQLDFNEKSVLDMGTGSGILAIFAGMLKAKSIVAVDYDSNATENAIENCNINGFSNVIVKTGSIEVIENKQFDIILANINRNILHEQLNKYAQSLNRDGWLILSGFYEADLPVLTAEAVKNNLILKDKSLNNKWSEMLLQKV